MQGGSDCQPQINLRSGMIQSRDETAKDWLLRVQRNIGTTVPTAEHQRACRSIFLSGLREEYRDRAMDLLPGDLQNLAANLDQGFGNAPESKPKCNVPASPRPVVRMLR
ncbi:unnamed protein product [Dibothriocephalus latus]|uniref:Uncharacterized protein n=1 Tax=Dibothriocephalus latus TaxID=60516 RepID=A0A3P6V2V7_DIBLA|nr:unnamed protein product [Dibothriocephalus latus]